MTPRLMKLKPILLRRSKAASQPVHVRICLTGDGQWRIRTDRDSYWRHAKEISILCPVLTIRDQTDAALLVGEGVVSRRGDCFVVMA